MHDMRSHMFQVTICIGDHTCILGGDGGNVSIIYGTSQQQSSYRYIRDRGKQFSLLLVNPCFIFENLELNKIKSINYNENSYLECTLEYNPTFYDARIYSVHLHFWQVKHFSSNWRHMYARSNIVQELINKKYIYIYM